MAIAVPDPHDRGAVGFWQAANRGFDTLGKDGALWMPERNRIGHNEHMIVLWLQQVYRGASDVLIGL